MTVRELIRRLETTTGGEDFTVFTEGCDCIGKTAYLAVDCEEKVVTIMREPIGESDFDNTKESDLKDIWR